MAAAIGLRKPPEGWSWYLCTYYYRGNAWSLELMAESVEDAQARLKCLSQARLDGEIAMALPHADSAWMARTLCWVLTAKDWVMAFFKR